MFSSLFFTSCLLITAGILTKRLIFIRHNIRLGKAKFPKNSRVQRWKQTLEFAFAQRKMITKRNRWAGFFHFLIYTGFVIINIELLEIIIDGVFNTHRFLSPYLGIAYPIIIYIFELLAITVILACIIFLLRRNVLNIKRLKSKELKGFPASDANIILIAEIILMSAFLLMNGSDMNLSIKGIYPYDGVFTSPEVFPSLIILQPLLDFFSNESLIIAERIGWWVHILGVFSFSIYITYSKHLHILLAFPNTYYASLSPIGKQEVSQEVQRVVQDYLAPSESSSNDDIPESIGAKDVTDLTKVNLLAAYSCTECGRCTEACPASQTGKLLSPRKIMMDTRDRLEAIGHGKKKEKTLLYGYIKPEEVLACTTCQACIVACPILINPLDIILKLRQYLAMEESKSPAQWITMFSNIENNGAPWQFSSQDRSKWRDQ